MVLLVHVYYSEREREREREREIEGEINDFDYRSAPNFIVQICV